MRTVTFKSVLHGVAIRMGLEPDVNFTNNQALAFTEFINEYAQEGIEKFDWPEWCTIEERFYRADYSALTAYSVGDQVYYPTTDAYYECIATSTGNAPTNTTYWEEASSDLDRYIDYDQTGETAIGEVFAVYQDNPFTTRSPVPVNYALSDNGIQIDMDAPTSVFVKFRKRPPVFTSTAWNSATSYAVGDLVYYSTTGECYISIQAGSNKNPSSQASYWTKVDFPYFLQNFVKIAAYAAALKEDGQQEKAVAEMRNAEDKLMNEFDKIWMQQQQVPTFKARAA